VSSELALPHRVGPYVLFDRIGQGGMAELFLAKNASGKLLVVKLILPVYAERSEFATMLADEAKLAATLSHANVVQVVDLGREQDRLFIAMEYVEGFDLAALLKRCSKDKVPMPPEFALHVVAELLAALDYAHKKDIVHRDVSPSNVLVSFDGEVKLCDFGIARANAALSGEQPSEAIKGKAGYMSPEHARGEVLDGRADVFAAGIILWELLAGRKLYRASEGDLIAQARAANIPELSSRGWSEEEKLHAIVKRALAPSRDERYATAGDMRRELLDWIAAAKMGASAIKLGDWLAEHFGQDLVAKRREREVAAKPLEAPAKPARALLTPEPPRITYKDDEPQPESIAPVDVSPSSKRPEPEKTKGPPWTVLAIGAIVAGVVAWLLSR
jgi:serine/threonine-protein kinase